MSVIEATYLWQKRARPETDKRKLEVALGVHLEEVCEQLESLELTFCKPITVPGHMLKAFVELKSLADVLKNGKAEITGINPKMFTDSICDQLVTGVGVGYNATVDIVGALAEVNRSNWSKFVDGEPIFDENGKITKGPNYSKPNLAPFVPTSVHNIPHLEIQE